MGEARLGDKGLPDERLEGDSRCSWAFRVAVAWSEMEGCLPPGEGETAPSPLMDLLVGSGMADAMFCAVVLDANCGFCIFRYDKCV